MLTRKYFPCPPTVKKSPQKLRIQRQILHIRTKLIEQAMKAMFAVTKKSRKLGLPVAGSF